MVKTRVPGGPNPNLSLSAHYVRSRLASLGPGSSLGGRLAALGGSAFLNCGLLSGWLAICDIGGLTT
jgi:hypothetical protein